MIESHINPQFDRKIFQDEVETAFGRIFSRHRESKDHTVQAIKDMYEEIGEEVPKIVVTAHKLLNSRPKTPLERAKLLTGLTGLAERLAIEYAEFNNFIDRLELLMLPAEMQMGADGKMAKMTMKEREFIMEGRVAPYKAIRDMLSYLFHNCARIASPNHQAALNLERDALKNPNSQ